MQVTTLFEDLNEEILTGQYINSVGQPQVSETLNSPLLDADAWESSVALSTGTAGPPSISSYPSQPFSRHVFNAAGALASATLPPPPPPPATRPPSRIPPRSTNPTGAAAQHSASGIAAAMYGAAAEAILGPRSRARLHSQPLARPHRAAVRAVLSMPCDPIPEGERAEFPPLPPFVSADSPAGTGRVSAEPAVGAPTAAAPAAPGVRWEMSSLYDQEPSTGSDCSDRPESARGFSPVPSAAPSSPPNANPDTAGSATDTARDSTPQLAASGDHPAPSDGGDALVLVQPQHAAPSTHTTAAGGGLADVAEPLMPWPTADDAAQAPLPPRLMQSRTLGTADLTFSTFGEASEEL